jgi:HSP20 family molecular chaperone IbpA
VPSINKFDIDLQVKDRTIRISSTRTIKYTGKARLQRRERVAGRCDLSTTLPAETDSNGVKVEWRDGILALSLLQAERAKARTIKIF